MTINPHMLTSVYWYKEFRDALESGKSDYAAECFKRYKYWKQRAAISDMLENVTKEMANGK